MDELLKKWQSRKFQIVSFLVIVNTLGYYLAPMLRLTPLSEGAYVSLTTLIVSAYIAGNVYQNTNTKEIK